VRTMLKLLSLAILIGTGHAALSQSVKPPFPTAISSPKDVVPPGGEVRVKTTLRNISDHESKPEGAPRLDQGESHHTVMIRNEHGNELSQELGSMGTVETLLILHLANGFVLLICFFSLGIKNPFKWFQQTRMKNMK